MPNTLKNAPLHIKLAIDIIQLLEDHQIPEIEALEALEVVKTDLLNKLTTTKKLPLKN